MWSMSQHEVFSETYFDQLSLGLGKKDPKGSTSNVIRDSFHCSLLLYKLALVIVYFNKNPKQQPQKTN